MTNQSAERPLLEIDDLVKDYGEVTVLRSMNLRIQRGEVRALMGVNGAGKSTLVNVLGGIVPITSGEIRISGEPFLATTPAEARAAGISIVHQELSLVPGLTVAENITLGRWKSKRIWGVPYIDAASLKREAEQALRLVGEDIPLFALAGDLAPAQQQLVEIAKALVDSPKILILDEPTSSLARHEVDVLLSLIRRLAAQGVTVIYVSHRMDEIPRVADSVTVMRDGREVQTQPVAEMNTSTIAALMVGKELAKREDRTTGEVGEALLEVNGLTRAGVIENVSFTVHAGEVVGVVGLMGSGRTELCRAIFGLDPASGTVSVAGRVIRRRSPQSLIRAGVGFTPEDRKGQGLALNLSVSANLVLTSFDLIRSRLGFLSARRERHVAAASIASQSIATPGADVEVSRLSGGNQQKVVIAKWLNKGVTVLLMDEPTRGVDVHAKSQTYDTITRMARNGGGVLFVSSEVEEVFLLCDRILVVRAGEIVREMAVNETTAEQVLALAMEEQEPVT